MNDAGPHGCLAVLTLLWSARGLWLLAAIEWQIEHASCHRDCGGGVDPCRLLLVLLRRLQVDAPNRTAPARLRAVRRRCADLPRAGLQDALLGCRARGRCRFLRHLHAEQVPAGYGPGAGHSHPRRFLQPRLDHGRSQPRDRRTSAGGPATQGGTEDIEAEKAKTTQADGRGTRGIALPRSGAGLRAGHAWPLIACTAPDSGLYAEPIMHKLRIAEP